MIKHSVFKYDFVIVSLRRVAPNTNEQRSRSGLCERVIRREATETEGLVLYNYRVGRSTDSNLLNEFNFVNTRSVGRKPESKL